MEISYYEKLLLKKIYKLNKEKYVIYGTKDVALIYYNEIVRQLGEESIHFFIDGRKDRDFFKGKPVYKCDEIAGWNINEYKYVIGSVSKVPQFTNNLRKLGVKEENIINTVNYFSPEFIDANIDKIQDIYIYPLIKDNDKIEEVIKELDNYITISLESDQHVKLFTSNNIETIAPYGYEIIMTSEVKLNINSEDIVLVWDASRLQDDELEGIENVFCYDNNFVLFLNSKVLSAVASKFLRNKSDEYYRELSKNHFDELLNSSKDFDSVMVCGTGPSINRINEEHKQLMNKSCIIVCNGFYKMKDLLKDIKPKVYVIQDNIYLTSNYRNELDGIIEYVVRNEVYLCINFRWVSLLCSRYPLLEERIIGFYAETNNIFPSYNNLSYNLTDNVITSMGIPIASSLSDNIFIIGCDGGSNGKWDHSYSKLSGVNFENYRDSFLHPKYNNVEEYNKTLNLLYQNILDYGESKGKKYTLLTHSYIPELEKRYIEVLS